MTLDKRLINKIINKCGEPEVFCYDEVIGNSIESGIRHMQNYVKLVNKIIKDYDTNKTKIVKADRKG